MGPFPVGPNDAPEQFNGVRNKWDIGGVSDTMEQPTWQ